MPRFNSALDAWPGHTTAHTLATKFHVNGCMDDLTIERRFDSQAKWVSDVLGFFLTFYTWMFIQLGTDRRPVDWCMN